MSYEKQMNYGENELWVKMNCGQFFCKQITSIMKIWSEVKRGLITNNGIFIGYSSSDIVILYFESENEVPLYIYV
jgi:hypothetical protein